MYEKITLEIKPDELKKLLLDYYINLYNDKSIIIEFYSSCEYHGIYEEEEYVTKVKLKRTKNINLSIGSCTSVIEEEIKVSDIKNILLKALSESKYDVLSVRLDTDCKTYGMYEQRKTYFNGLVAHLKPKETEKQKTL